MIILIRHCDGLFPLQWGASTLLRLLISWGSGKKQLPACLAPTIIVGPHCAISEGHACFHTNTLQAALGRWTIRGMHTERLASPFNAETLIAWQPTWTEWKVHTGVVLLVITNHALTIIMDSVRFLIAFYCMSCRKFTRQEEKETIINNLQPWKKGQCKWTNFQCSRANCYWCMGQLLLMQK